MSNPSRTHTARAVAAVRVPSESRNRRRGGSRRGIERERRVRDLLQSQDWLAFRAPASLGVADVVALRLGSRPRLIEVKSTAGGPYERFQPAARARLSAAAKLAGADALLAWWPPRGELHWIAESEWPR
jgi:Holliday junction resolvase